MKQHLLSAALRAARWLIRQPRLRQCLLACKAKPIVNGLLQRFPIKRRLSHNIHRIAFADSLILAYEMFGGDEYDTGYFPDKCSTFADLGCNVGFFTCLLNQHYQTNNLRGLMVDANPAVMPEVLWHLDANELKEVYFYQGVVGTQKREFFVFDFSTISSTEKDAVVKYVPKYENQWQRIEAEPLNVHALWCRSFGAAVRCNVLKVDIEGSELEFFRTEQSFLKLVDFIAVEWHGWACKLPDLRAVLEPQGFILKGAKHENEDIGIAYFRRRTGV